MNSQVNSASRLGPKFLLLDSDPYLAFLLQLQVPKAVIVEDHRQSDLDTLIADSPDVVIVNVTDKRARELVARKGQVRVIGVSEMSAESLIAPEGLDGVVQRPFVPAELHRTLVKVLGISPGELPLPYSAGRYHRWFGLARLATVGLAALLDLGASGRAGRPGIVLIGAFLYVLIRLTSKRITPTGAGIDIGAATILMILTGGSSSGYVFLGLVAAAEAGLVLQTRIAVMAGGLLAMGSFVEVYRAAVSGRVPPRELIAWLVIFPLAAIAASMASRMWQSGGATEKVLSEANRLLSSLHRIARTVPGQLDARGAASAAVDRIQDGIGYPSGSVWLAEAGMFASVISYGSALPTETILEQSEPFIEKMMTSAVLEFTTRDLPGEIQDAFSGEPAWLVAPMIHDGVPNGFIIVAPGSADQGEASKVVLQQIAKDTAVAIENARLFRRVREMSIDEERKRLARELHDGVSQALTHIRLELEFLARHGPPNLEAAGEEAARLSRVVSRASSEVRAMINGLSSTVDRDGLAVSLGTYLRDLRGLVTRDISFECSAVGNFPPEVENEVFRIAQEAVSNALRHSKSGAVRVKLESDGLRLALAVEDNGVGVSLADRGSGLGLHTMQERARTVGGRLEIRSSSEGTIIELLIGQDEAVEEDERLEMKSA